MQYASKAHSHILLLESHRKRCFDPIKVRKICSFFYKKVWTLNKQKTHLFQISLLSEKRIYIVEKVFFKH